MRPILFLDIDGVLNDTLFLVDLSRRMASLAVVDGAWDGTDHIDPVRVTRLNRVLAETNASVVLSSSWRRLFGLDDTRRMLETHGFRGQFVGETPRIHDVERHREIRAWLEANEHGAFVILDDDPAAGTGFDASFVWVKDGLEDEHVARAVAVLGGS